MEKFIKVIDLMLYLGYDKHNARKVADDRLQRIADINPLFEVEEIRNFTELLTIEEADHLLLSMMEEPKAKEILINGYPEELITTDDEYKSPISIESRLMDEINTLKTKLRNTRKELKEAKRELKNSEVKELKDIKNYLAYKGLDKDYSRWLKYKG